MKKTVILNIHGGGFYGGNKDSIRRQMSFFADKGYFVASLNYPLPKKHLFPAAIVSTMKAAQFLETIRDGYEPPTADSASLLPLHDLERSDALTPHSTPHTPHSTTYNIDTNSIIITGDSAGAYYAALAALCFKDEAMRAKVGIKIEGKLPKVSAVMLFCGMYNLNGFLNGSPKFVMRDMVKSGFGRIPTEEELNALSPVNYIDGDYPPTFVTYGGKDILKNESLLLIEKLKEQGVPYDFYEGVKNGHDFQFDLRKQSSMECLNKAAEFLKLCGEYR